MLRKGFVDLQVNGWMGKGFDDGNLQFEDVRRITRELLQRGTIAYCPTLVSASPAVTRRNLALLARACRDPDIGGRLLGIHVEGPFISPEPGARGAHNARFVRDPSVREFDRFQESADGRIVLMTLDPSRPGALGLIRHAVRQGVIVSLGHHLADERTLEKAARAGATACTHVGNGIPNRIHRHRNPLWWQLSRDDMWGLFITDGHHLPTPLIKVALRAKTADRFIVTSDASPLAGMPPGRYQAMGTTAVINAAGRIYSEAHQGLVGSHATLLECVNHLASLKLLDERELWKVGCDNPLKLLGKQPAILRRLDGPKVVFENGRFRTKTD